MTRQMRAIGTANNTSSVTARPTSNARFATGYQANLRLTVHRPAVESDTRSVTRHRALEALGDDVHVEARGDVSRPAFTHLSKALRRHGA